MQYRRLGRSDIRVSAICLGTMTWGEQNTEADGFAQMDRALDRGVNFWDVAEMYPVPPRKETYGHTEAIIGNWFASRKRRDKVVLATKIAGTRHGSAAGVLKEISTIINRLPASPSPDDIDRCIKYVEDNPLKDGKARQSWSFVASYAPA